MGVAEKLHEPNNDPYVLLSCAASVDGYIDDTSGERLQLSNAEDFDRVDEVRASCDAILVGANTIRSDNPRLLVRDRRRRDDRVARGLPASPTKVTITSRGDRLDPGAQFFAAPDTPDTADTGDAADTGDMGDMAGVEKGVEKIVFCADPTAEACRARLGGLATVVAAGDPVDPRTVLTDLAARGVRRLMVEGGTAVHTQFLTEGLADELQLVIAPFFVGDAAAPRLVGPGRFPQHPGNRMTLADVRQIGDVVLLRYLPR